MLFRSIDNTLCCGKPTLSLSRSTLDIQFQLQTIRHSNQIQKKKKNQTILEERPVKLRQTVVDLGKSCCLGVNISRNCLIVSNNFEREFKI